MHINLDEFHNAFVIFPSRLNILSRAHHIYIVIKIGEKKTIVHDYAATIMLILLRYSNDEK